MFEFAKEWLTKKTQSLDKENTKIYIQRESHKRKVNSIDRYFQLKSRQKNSENKALVCLILAILTSFSCLAYPPTVIITLLFSFLSIMNTRDIVKIRKKIRKNYSNFSKMSYQQLLEEKDSLLQKIEKLLREYENNYQIITKCKFYLQKIDNYIVDLENPFCASQFEKDVNDYLDSGKSLDVYLDSIFDSLHCQSDNDIGDNISYFEKSKQLKKAI